MNRHSTRIHKYVPGYIQGALSVQAVSKPGRYIVWCNECENFSEMAVSQLSIGKMNCGCKEQARVYFILVEVNNIKYMKIGGTTADNMRRRLYGYNTHWPIHLEPERYIDGPRDIEKITQAYFNEALVHIPERNNKEWFYFRSEMLTVTLEDLIQ